MKPKSYSYSSFLRGPSEILEQLDQHDVVLECRDQENLVLTREHRYNARNDAMSFAARLLGEAVRGEKAVMVEALTRQLPWLHWLPEDGRIECVDELIAELAAGADTGLFDPFLHAFYSWRSTARAYNDPEIMRLLKERSEPDGRVIARPKLNK